MRKRISFSDFVIYFLNEQPSHIKRNDKNAQSTGDSTIDPITDLNINKTKKTMALQKSRIRKNQRHFQNSVLQRINLKKHLKSSLKNNSF